MVQEIIEGLRRRPIGGQTDSYKELFDLGLNLKLPAQLMGCVHKSGTPLGETSVYNLLDLAGWPTHSLLERNDEMWTHSLRETPSIIYILGNWWPMFAFRRIEGLIRAIPDTYTGLDLTEHLSLAKALDWTSEAVCTYGGATSRLRHDVLFWLKHCQRSDNWGSIDEKQQMVIVGERDRCMPVQPQYLALIRALIERQRKLKISLPEM